MSLSPDGCWALAVDMRSNTDCQCHLVDLTDPHTTPQAVTAGHARKGAVVRRFLRQPESGAAPQSQRYSHPLVLRGKPSCLRGSLRTGVPLPDFSSIHYGGGARHWFLRSENISAFRSAARLQATWAE